MRIKCRFCDISGAVALATSSLTVAACVLLSVSVPSIATGQAIRTRDSAGVHIVENPARATYPVNLRLAGKPVLDVGGLESNPDDEFNSKQGYLRGVSLGNGGFVVIDEHRVHYFTAAGKRERIAGRQGAGPADLAYVIAICRTRGDTIVLGDPKNHRMSVLDRNGGVVRTIPMGDNSGMPFDACFDDGTFVLKKFLPPTSAGDHLMRLTRMRLDGSIANVFGDFPGIAFDVVTQNETNVVALGDRLYYGTGQSSEVREYSLTGKLIAIVRSADPVVPIRAAEAGQRISATVHLNGSAAERSARMRAIPHASVWPAYAGMHVDRQGRLWVEGYRKEYPMADSWSAFDASGRLVGRLVLPAPPKGERAMQVIGFGDNSILVRRTDSDGAEHLTAYGILGLGPERR